MLTIHVLFRFSQKTGKIDTTMTSLGKHSTIQPKQRAVLL